jgi:PAS domain S-box-containing protein
MKRYEQIHPDQIHILVADDEKAIRDTLQEAIGYVGYRCSVASHGKEALTILDREPVDVVITDIMMPSMDGIELTKIIKKKYSTDVIMMTGFVKDFTYENIIDLGVSDFMEKPVGIKELIIRLKRVLRERFILSEQKKFEFIVNTAKELIALVDINYTYEVVNDSYCQIQRKNREEVIGRKVFNIWGEDIFKKKIKEHFDLCFAGIEVHDEQSITLSPVEDRSFDITYYPYAANGKTISHAIVVSHDISERKRAESEIKLSLENLRKAMGATIQTLALTVETRDPYTAGHQKRVADLAGTIAREMDLPTEQVDGIQMAGAVHDIGKISVPAEILSKPTKLSDIEIGLIRTHPQAGYDILKDIDFPWPIARIILEHHERMDGSGYPCGVTGDNILIESRILSVADVVEAIASHRPYRPALGLEKALEVISSDSGVLYDANVVTTCIKLFHEKGFNFI